MRYLVAIIILFTTTQVSSQTATNISVKDTRDIVSVPTEYNKEVRFEFKRRSFIDVPGSGSYSGLFTIAPWADNSGNKTHQINFNDGGLFYRNGWPDGETWAEWRKLLMLDENNRLGIGVESALAKLDVRGDVRIMTNDDAVLSFENTDDSWQYLQFIQSGRRKTWMGLNTTNDFCIYKEDGGDIVFSGGKVGIGDSSPEYTLDVAGTIRTQELKVDMQGADFVFEEDYPLRPISELEDFVKANKHLPEIAPAKEMQENGVNQSEMNQKLLQKIEELTLYTIEQEKEIEDLKALNKKLSELQLRLEKLESK